MTEHRDPADLRDHEAAALVPMMSPAEFADLVADVKVVGVKDDLDVLPDGRVLDGRNRLRAAREAGLAEVPVRVLDLDEAGAVEHIFRTALLRRNLSDDQRAVLVARFREALTASARKARAKKAARTRWHGCSEDTASSKHEGNGRSREALAQTSNVPERKLRLAVQLQAKAPELAEKVLAGEINLTRARRAFERQEKQSRPEQLQPCPAAGEGTVEDVLAGRARFALVPAEALAFFGTLPADSIDGVLF
jgi:ParB-like chromosome segregation protein Spo0J